MTFKTTHVGSLPRPRLMLAKNQRKEQITREDLRHCLRDIVGKQVSLGITCINNGELPRADYVTSTLSRISGFGASATAPMPRDLEDLPDFAQRFSGRNGLITLNTKAPVKLPACSAPLRYTGEASLREELEMLAEVFDDLKQSEPDLSQELFFTSPSPGTIALFMEDTYYGNYRNYLEKLGSVLKREYEIIAGYGFQLQIDAPDLAMGRHTRFKELSDHEFLSIIDTHVAVLNQALAQIDPCRCRVHVCWGNYPGTHHFDIGLKTIFPHIMRLKPCFISLEASNHRHAHEWTVFKELPFPEDKVLLPGVIDTTSTIVEHPDLVAWRIANYAHLLGPDRVIGSTDCGFASTASATNVTGDIAWLKLASLTEGARRAGAEFR